MSHGEGNIEDFYIKKVPILGSLMKWMKSNDMDYTSIITVLSLSLLIISLAVFGVSAGSVISVFFCSDTDLVAAGIIFSFLQQMDGYGRSQFLSQ